jgi:hypothetical protein
MILNGALQSMPSKYEYGKVPARSRYNAVVQSTISNANAMLPTLANMLWHPH